MNKKIVILLVVLVIILVGFVAFTFLRGNKIVDNPVPSTTNTTSTNQTSTTTDTDSTPIFTAVGAAVEGNFADADVVKLPNGKYRMYYAIQPEVQGHKFEVYSSISSDGITWTKESGTRKTFATFPDVVITKEGKYRFYYQSAGLIKSAISTDGLTFTDEAGTRIDKTNSIGLTFDNVAAPSVYLNTDNTYTMVYRGTSNIAYQGETVPNKDTQVLMWATSTDGLTWVKKGLAVDTRNSTLYNLGDGPELFKYSDGKIKLSFWSYSGVYWSDFDGSSFSTPKKIFALAEATAMNKFPTPTPGDPTYANVGEDWYMYYGQKESIDYAKLSDQPQKLILGLKTDSDNIERIKIQICRRSVSDHSIDQFTNDPILFHHRNRHNPAQHSVVI